MARRATDRTGIDVGRPDNTGDDAGDNVDPSELADAGAGDADPADGAGANAGRAAGGPARPAKVKVGRKMVVAPGKGVTAGKA